MVPPGYPPSGARGVLYDPANLLRQFRSCPLVGVDVKEPLTLGQRQAKLALPAEILELVGNHTRAEIAGDLRSSIPTPDI